MKPRSISVRCFGALIIVLFSALAWTGNAATYTWNNPAGGNWSNPTNWDLDAVPGPGDIAKITTAGSYTVTDDQPTTTIAEIIVGNELPLTGVQQFLVPAGTTLTATAPITINDNGTFTVLNGGTVELADTAPLHLLGPGTNFGIIVLTNSSIYLYNDGSTAALGGLINESGGLILLLGSGGIISALRPDDYFINRGLVSKIVGTGSSSIAASVGVLGGAYSGAEGTTIQLGGGTAPAPLAADRSLFLLGFAQFQFVSGFLLFSTNVIPGLDLKGGTLELGPSFQDYGEITNLTLDGINLGQANDSFIVEGNLIITNGSVPASLTILPLRFASASDVTFSGQMLNYGGTFVVQSGTATFGDGTHSNSWVLNKFGQMEVEGVLTLNCPMTNYFATIDVTNSTSIQAFNNGTAALAGGLVNEPGGVINLWNNSSLDGAARGNEYFINQGTVNKMSGTAQSTIDFSFLNNAGTLSSQHGTLLLQSTHPTLQSSETLGVVLNSATDYGKLSVVGSAPLNGVFQVGLSNAYVPPVGTIFSVVSYGSLASNFTGFNYPPRPTSIVWQPAYGNTALTLQVQSGFNLGSSGTGLVTRVDGLPGHQAILLTSTNVALPLANWTPLSTNTLDLTGYLSLTNNLVPTEPQRFFTFKLP